jgi:hypothetical protein
LATFGQLLNVCIIIVPNTLSKHYGRYNYLEGIIDFGDMVVCVIPTLGLKLKEFMVAVSNIYIQY